MAATGTAATTRRDFLYIATGAVGAVGAAATVWPLISQMNPDASVLALAAIEVDLAPIAEGQIAHRQMARQAGVHPHRTKKEIDEARATPLSRAARSADRRGAGVKKGHDEWLVIVGICTHLGCVPLGHQGEYDGWFCPCHGSRLRHLRPHPAGPGAEEPRGSALRVPRPTPRSGSAERGVDGGHSTYQPQSRFMQLVGSRLPIGGLVHSSFVAYPTPRNLNYWWTFGAILTFMLVAQIVTGVVLAMHYTPTSKDGVRFGRAHHARRELRLAAPLPARQRRVDVLPRRLHPHVPRPLLRLLQGAARGALDPRRHHLPADDGDRLHGLRAALGPDELLGRDRDHQPVLGDPAGRQRDHPVAVGRLRGRPADAATASTRCTICCRS